MSAIIPPWASFRSALHGRSLLISTLCLVACDGDSPVSPEAGIAMSRVWAGDGFTFGHDADLANPAEVLDESRIDYVMFRGKVAAATAAVVDTLLDPTPLQRPLWPSDHGGVVATLALNRR